MLKKRYIFPFFIAFMAALIILPGFKTSYAETTYNPVPYEDIGEILEQHERDSDRISVEVIGQSALGLDLYAVTIFDPEDDEGMEESENLRDLMIGNPQKAQEYVDENPDVKVPLDRKSTRLNSSHVAISYAVFCLKKKKKKTEKHTH